MTFGSLRLLPLLAHMKQAGRKMSLSEVSLVAEMSPSHLQRVFTAEVNESPAAYQKRLRLEHAATKLRSTSSRIIDIAFDAGFESHQAFTRAFTTHFGVAPKDYRSEASRLSPELSKLISDSGPCVGLYGIKVSTNTKEDPMATSAITRETVSETHTVVARRRADKEHLAEAFAECLPAAYGYAMESGLTMAGPPFVRYVNQSAAFFEIEAGVPVVESPGTIDNPDLFASTLPGGHAAIAIHTGPYDSLGDTHVAIDRWVAENGHTLAGGPWEIYLTDPGEVPDPNEWKTQIIYPLM